MEIKISYGGEICTSNSNNYSFKQLSKLTVLFGPQKVNAAMQKHNQGLFLILI